MARLGDCIDICYTLAYLLVCHYFYMLVYPSISIKLEVNLSY